MADWEGAEQALVSALESVAKKAEATASESQARAALCLAEALAWVHSPAQPHGGGGSSS